MSKAHPFVAARACVRHRTLRPAGTGSTRHAPTCWWSPARSIRTTIGLLALALVGCADVRLLATPTAPAAPPSPVASTSAGLAFGDPACVEYDDYQSAAMAFYSLSAIVQDGLDSASGGVPAESLDAAVARFEVAVRLALAGETLTDPDPIEELALFWVASDGCMR